jgi:MFS family permease
MKIIDRALWHFFKINLAKQDDRNAWYLVLEVFWASLLGSVAVFNAAFAIRLGADNFQVGLLSSIPALMAVLVSIPAGNFLQRRSRRAPWVFGSLLAHRAGYLLVALAPLMGFLGIEPGLLVVVILVMISAPAHFFNVGWIPLLADVVPESRRAAVFTARNIVNQATVSVMVFLFGLWLNQIVFPINYQTLYLLGFVSSMLSMYYLYKMVVPDSPAEKPATLPKIRTFREWLVVSREALTGQPAFMRITVNTLLHGFGVWMAGPLYALYFVRTLEASDAWLGLNGTIASVGTIAGYSLWRWILARWGEPTTLKRTIVLVGVYPILVGLTPSLPVILLYGALNGLIVPGTNLSHFNTLLKVTPADARPRYTAIYITIMNLGATVSPLISVALATVFGLEVMLVASGLISVIGSTSFWWWPVVAPATPPQAEPAA